MTKKTSYDDDFLIDQPETEGYYYGNLFRFPDEEMTRPMQPAMPSKKGVYPKSPQKPVPTAPGYMQDNMSDMMPMQTQPPMVPVAPDGMMDVEGMLQPTLTNIGYTQAFLKTLIGRRVRISFLIGTQMLVDRVGTLTDVGISYVVLRVLDANVSVMCDLYSIKFVDIYDTPVSR